MPICKHRLMALTGLVASLLLVFAAMFGVAHAADKGTPKVGGDCCSDLEERIAELEATTAKKGNHKVRLTVSGSINQAILVYDDKLTGKSDARVISNSTTDSYLNFAGSATFGKDLSAGFVIELGVGRFDVLTDQLGVNHSTDIYTRRTAVWIKGPIGKLTIGKDSESTDGVVDGTSVVNTAPATRMLSFRPLLGGDGITENVDLFDGQRLDVVRYDSLTLNGFMVSASWSRDGTAIGNVDDVWSLALRYFGEVQNFKVAGAVGYRKGGVFPGLDPFVPLPQIAFDQETISGSTSVLHMPTGVFLNMAAGQAKFSGVGIPKITGWELMPGIEEKWMAIGKTTIYGQYALYKIDGASDDLTFYGAGIVQAVDAAAMSLYLSGRHVDPGNGGDAFNYAIGGIKLDY